MSRRGQRGDHRLVDGLELLSRRVRLVGHQAEAIGRPPGEAERVAPCEGPCHRGRLAALSSSVFSSAAGIELRQREARRPEHGRRDQLAAGEAEHVAVARVAAGHPDVVEPGTRPTTGRKSITMPKMPAQA